MAAVITLVLLVATFACTLAEVEIITAPKPGQEYVFVQTQGSGARPIFRKDKVTSSSKDHPFETAHKLPQTLKYALHEDGVEVRKKRSPAESPAPAPAGAIKLDPLKLLEKYKTALKSSTAAPKTSTTTKSPTRRGVRTTSQRSNNNKRSKKAAPVTDPTPILTTATPTPRKLDDDVPLVQSPSEKQRSRIEIKKGPNGQEYEYEYVYYYYDDYGDGKNTQKQVSNAHDGPAKNQIAKDNKEVETPIRQADKTTAAPEPAANEIVPALRGSGRNRGRQLDVEETVGEERLPANTRFPPRSRNLATTSAPEEENKTSGTRKTRIRTTTEAAVTETEKDSVSDESQGSRGRTRPNVRRPSLELVDSASFNTHSGTAGTDALSGGPGPSFPSNLPAGPVRFVGATPNEREPIVERNNQGQPESPKEEANSESTSTRKEDAATESTLATDATTTMSAMDKVALDLYAISQGTQKLSGEEGEFLASEATDTTEEDASTINPFTTEPSTTEFTTPATTTTTTTTTTTPAPTTTTTTTEATGFGRNKFRGRGPNGRRTSTTSSPSTEASADSKPKNRFGRPSFGARPRPGTRTTAEPAAEQDANKEETKSSQAKPTNNRPRFSTANRNRARPTPSSEDAASHDETHSTAAPRPSLSRPRPTFNLRGRTRPTAHTTEESSAAGGDDSSASSSVATEVSSTTPRVRGRVGQTGSVRPLRPGPRLNLARGRPGVGASTTEAAQPAPVEENVGEEGSHDAAEGEKDTESSPAPPQDNSPLSRLRNKNRPNINPTHRPKQAASAPVQVRRINPLLARRKPGAAEPSTSEAPQEAISTEINVSEEPAETDAPASTSTTTEEPRGLNKLLAGRRRLAARQPGTIA